MDAVKFLVERQRMCDKLDCNACPLYRRNEREDITECTVLDADHAAQSVAVVEKWADEHPRKTRQSEFLQRYPHAKIEPENGILELPPCFIEPAMRGHGSCRGIPCINCRKEYWLQEVE